MSIRTPLWLLIPFDPLQRAVIKISRDMPLTRCEQKAIARVLERAAMAELDAEESKGKRRTRAVA